MRNARIALIVLLAAGCSSNTIGLEEGNDAADMTTSDTGESTSGPDSSSPTTAATTATTAPNPTTAGPDPSTTGAMTSPTTSPPPPDTGPDTVGTATSGPVFDLGGGEVSFFGDVAPILQSQCAPACHEPGGEWPTQDLLNSPYFALVNVPSTQNPLMNKVEPGSVDDSYMWHKLHDTHVDVGGSGLPMPKGNMMLASDDLDIIEVWIIEGALNN